MYGFARILQKHITRTLVVVVICKSAEYLHDIVL